jgi:hypothetical protein
LRAKIWETEVEPFFARHTFKLSVGEVIGPIAFCKMGAFSHLVPG